MDAWLRIIENHELTRGEQLKVVTEAAQGRAETIAGSSSAGSAMATLRNRETRHEPRAGEAPTTARG